MNDVPMRFRSAICHIQRAHIFYSSSQRMHFRHRTEYRATPPSNHLGHMNINALVHVVHLHAEVFAWLQFVPSGWKEDERTHMSASMSITLIIYWHIWKNVCMVCDFVLLACWAYRIVYYSGNHHESPNRFSIKIILMIETRYIFVNDILCMTQQVFIGVA